MLIKRQVIKVIMIFRLALLLESMLPRKHSNLFLVQHLQWLRLFILYRRPSDVIHSLLSSWLALHAAWLSGYGITRMVWLCGTYFGISFQFCFQTIFRCSGFTVSISLYGQDKGPFSQKLEYETGLATAFIWFTRHIRL